MVRDEEDDWFVKMIELPNVYEWPVKWRHVFVLTLPVSGPLWVVYVILLGSLLMVGTILLLPVVGLMALWNGEDKW